jgi:hypothetical protein
MNGRLLRWADAMTIPDHIAFGILFVLMMWAVAAHFQQK